VAGDQALRDRESCDAARRFVTAQDRVAKERLMRSLLCQSHRFRRAFRRYDGGIHAGLSAECVAQQCGLPNQSIPVRMKLVPYLSIQFACVRQSRYFHPLKRRIESAEIPELSRNGSRGTGQELGEFLHGWVVGLGLVKRNPAVEFECQYGLFTAP